MVKPQRDLLAWLKDFLELLGQPDNWQFSQTELFQFLTSRFALSFAAINDDQIRQTRRVWLSQLAWRAVGADIRRRGIGVCGHGAPGSLRRTHVIDELL